MTDGKGCECFARCEADCVCDADWTPEEVIRLRADIEQMKRALRVIWTWANYDRAHGYRALVPEHVAELCKAALAAKEE